MENKIRDLAYLKYHYGGVARMDDFLTELTELFEKELKETDKWLKTYIALFQQTSTLRDRYIGLCESKDREITELKANYENLCELDLLRQKSLHEAKAELKAKSELFEEETQKLKEDIEDLQRLNSQRHQLISDKMFLEKQVEELKEELVEIERQMGIAKAVGRALSGQE